MVGNRRIEPGLVVIFRYFSAIAMLYFAIIVAITTSQEGTIFVPYLRWSLINLLLYLVVFIYLSWPRLRERSAPAYLPLALTMATVLPFLTNILDYLSPTERTLMSLILRSWLMFPILLVPLVILAWQYRLRYVILFAALTALFEEVMLLPIVGSLNFESLSILGQPLIRAFCFGLTGQIVCHLMDAQRAQRRALIHANQELSRQASMLEQLTVSRERNRLAREMHDTLAHTLSALSVNLEAMKTTVPSSLVDLQQMLDQSLQITRQGLTDTRRALKALRSNALEELGLSLAIRNLAETIASKNGLALTLKVDEYIPELSPAREQNIYRIAQEALENAARHAGAGKLTVELQLQGKSLLLLVQDDGAGFDPQKAQAGDHLGLMGMQERADSIQGELEIESRVEAGTALRLRLTV